MLVTVWQKIFVSTIIKRGGFEIMQEYKMDKKFFSADDLSTLLMGLSSLSSIVRGDEVVHERNHSLHNNILANTSGCLLIQAGTALLSVLFYFHGEPHIQTKNPYP